MLNPKTEAVMSKLQENPKVMSRETLIAALRSDLARRANGEMSICRLAAERGIFCKGMRRYSDEELRDRYSWIVSRNRDISREQLEEVADRWQMARQDVDNVPTSCDVQQIEHDTCGGWDDFTDEDLSCFLSELRTSDDRHTSV
jgi:hypothetical protein